MVYTITGGFLKYSLQINLIVDVELQAPNEEKAIEDCEKLWNLTVFGSSVKELSQYTHFDKIGLTDFDVISCKEEEGIIDLFENKGGV